MQHEHDQARIAPARVVAGGVDQRVDAVHLHRAVALDGDHRAIRVGELGGDRVRQRRAHRRQRARERGAHPGAQPQLTRPPVGARAGVGGHDRAVGQELVELPQHPLRVQRLGVEQAAVLDDLPPARDVVLDLLAPRAVRLALEQRQQRAQRLARVAAQVDLHRVADAEHARVEVDLNAAGLALLGQPLGVGEARADHQQRVAAGHHLLTGLGPEQADRAGHPRQVVGQDVAAVERARHAAAERVGDLRDLLGGAAGALTDQHRDLRAGVEDLGGAAQVGVGRQHAGRGDRAAAEDRPVLARRVLVGLLLDIGGHDHGGDRARRLRDPVRPVDHMARLRGRRDLLHVLARDVLEQHGQVDLLLVARAERDQLLLADDRDHGLVVELGVVETVEQVDRARAGGRHADADLAGELGVGAGHERRQLLVARLHELELVAVLVERAQQPVDPVTGIAVDALHAEAAKALQDEGADVLGHAHCLPASPARPGARFAA